MSSRRVFVRVGDPSSVGFEFDLHVPDHQLRGAIEDLSVACERIMGRWNKERLTGEVQT